MTPPIPDPIPEEELPVQAPADDVAAETELLAEETAEVETAETGEADSIKPEEISVEAGEEAEPAEKLPPSKYQLLLRKVGIWALITLAVFLLVGLLAYFQIYRPVKQNVAVLEGQLAAAQTELAGTQADLAEAEELYAESQAEVEIANARVRLYQVLNSVTIAQAALDQKDGQTALTALKAAQTTLEEMLPVVARDAPEVADQIDIRLKAAISSLGGDYKTTQSDLEILSALLLQQDKIFIGK